MPRAHQWASPLAAGTPVLGGPEKSSMRQGHVLLTTSGGWPLGQRGLAPGATGREPVGEASHVGAGRGSHRGLILKGVSLHGGPFSIPLTHTWSRLLPPDRAPPNLISPCLTLSASFPV